jgi:hypothetical protein
MDRGKAPGRERARMIVDAGSQRLSRIKTPRHPGFFIYGIGMGGTAILVETIWADFFGRTSLGKIRGMGSLVTSVFSLSE